MHASYRFFRASIVAALPCVVALAVLAHGVGFFPVELLRASELLALASWVVLLLAPLYLSVVVALYVATRVLSSLGFLSPSSLLLTFAVPAFALALLLGIASLPPTSLLPMALVALVALAGFIPAALLWWRVAQVAPKAPE